MSPTSCVDGPDQPYADPNRGIRDRRPAADPVDARSSARPLRRQPRDRIASSESPAMVPRTTSGRSSRAPRCSHRRSSRPPKRSPDKSVRSGPRGLHPRVLVGPPDCPERRRGGVPRAANTATAIIHRLPERQAVHDVHGVHRRSDAGRDPPPPAKPEVAGWVRRQCLRNAHERGKARSAGSVTSSTSTAPTRSARRKSHAWLHYEPSRPAMTTSPKLSSRTSPGDLATPRPCVRTPESDSPSHISPCRPRR